MEGFGTGPMFSSFVQEPVWGLGFRVFGEIILFLHIIGTMNARKGIHESGVEHLEVPYGKCHVSDFSGRGGGLLTLRASFVTVP